MEMKKVKKNVIAVCEYSNITIICHLLLKVKQEVNALEMLLINPKILKKKKMVNIFQWMSKFVCTFALLLSSVTTFWNNWFADNTVTTNKDDLNYKC